MCYVINYNIAVLTTSGNGPKKKIIRFGSLDHFPHERCGLGMRLHTHVHTEKFQCWTTHTLFSLLLIQGGPLHRAASREGEREGVGGEGDINSAE